MNHSLEEVQGECKTQLVQINEEMTGLQAELNKMTEMNNETMELLRTKTDECLDLSAALRGLEKKGMVGMDTMELMEECVAKVVEGCQRKWKSVLEQEVVLGSSGCVVAEGIHAGGGGRGTCSNINGGGGGSGGSHGGNNKDEGDSDSTGGTRNNGSSISYNDGHVQLSSAFASHMCYIQDYTHAMNETWDNGATCMHTLRNDLNETLKKSSNDLSMETEKRTQVEKKFKSLVVKYNASKTALNEMTNAFNWNVLELKKSGACACLGVSVVVSLLIFFFFLAVLFVVFLFSCFPQRMCPTQSMHC